VRFDGPAFAPVRLVAAALVAEAPIATEHAGRAAGPKPCARSTVCSLVSSPQRKPATTQAGIRVVSRGPPPLPATVPSAMPSAPVLVSAAPAGAVRVTPSLAPEDERAVQHAISASIAPLLQKQHELEARLEREATERQRLRDEVERLRQATHSLSAPAGSEPLPEMLDGARRGHRVLVGILVIVALILTAMISAMIVSQTR
jgi:hypothetical protein